MGYTGVSFWVANEILFLDLDGGYKGVCLIIFYWATFVCVGVYVCCISVLFYIENITSKMIAVYVNESWKYDQIEVSGNKIWHSKQPQPKVT